MSKENILILDTNNLLCRAYFAVPAMTSPEGVPNNGVYGLVKMVTGLIRDWSPTHIVAVFDHPSKNWRHDLYPEYKAHRREKSDAWEDIGPQFSLAVEALEALNICTVSVAGQEADDVVATIAKDAAFCHVQATVVSSDKDLLQLVIDNEICMLDTMANVLYKESDVIAKLGVSASQVQEYLSLVGDTSDNVPGVRGVGPKTAAKLLAVHATLEQVLKAAEGGTMKDSKTRERLIAHAGIARLSHQLVGLNDTVAVPSISTYRVQHPVPSTLRNFYERNGFTSLMREVG